ncbi:hypothetical protein NO746_000000305 [Citrobacter freundii]
MMISYQELVRTFLKSGVSWAELLPGDFLDTLEQAEKINIRTLRQQLK